MGSETWVSVNWVVLIKILVAVERVVVGKGKKRGNGGGNGEGKEEEENRGSH